MTITQIRYFLEIADCGGIQRAAEKNYISHQALSKQLKALEAEVGAVLLDRTGGKGLQLTESGEIFYRVWAEMIRKHEEALDQIARIRNAGENRIAVAIQDVRSIRYGCIQAFQTYTETRSGISFDYRIGNPNETLSLLENGQADIAFMSSLSVEHPEKFCSIVLKEYCDTPVIAVPNENPLSKRAELSLNELAHETFIMIGTTYSQTIVKRQKKDFAVYGITPNVILVPNPKELELALALNRGVCLLHESLLRNIREQVTVFPFAPARGNETYGILLLWRDKKHDCLAAELAEVIRNADPFSDAERL